MTNILEKIVQDKKDSLIEIKKANSLDVLEKKIKTPKLVEERNLEGMMSKPPNILVQFLKSSPEMPVWWRVEFCWSNGRWRHCT